MYQRDIEIEKNRFDKKAKNRLSESTYNYNNGSDAICESIRSPYLYFEGLIKKNLKKNMRVLEIGSGTGEYTGSILEHCSNVTASDISPNCIKLIENKYQDYLNNGTLHTAIANMGNLPFDDETFDSVVIAGSLSYGKASIVDKEINRVLKKGGIFLCVDSLNDNFIYRFNRYIHFLKHNRTRLTLENMPDVDRLENLHHYYSKISLHYFGGISWIMFFLKKIIGRKIAKRLSDYYDNVFSVKSSAFKFVLIARK